MWTSSRIDDVGDARSEQSFLRRVLDVLIRRDSVQERIKSQTDDLFPG